MSAEIVLWLFLGLFTKHFICDFLVQGPYQYLNKGKYGHLGGVLHSGIQVMGTAVAFLLVFHVTIPLLTVLAYVGAFEFVVHYHIDWAKMNINNHFKLQPHTSEQFWYLLGLDQYLHYVTYVAIVWYLVNGTKV
jgi:hypothetical protein